MKQTINLNINNTKISAEVDTGCPIILIGAQLYRRHFHLQKLQPIQRPLFDASGNNIKLLGSFNAKISTQTKSG